jgi:Carboxypeptidase regulatory-like domain
MKRAAFGILLVFCTWTLAFAQGGATGALSGVVQDSSSAAVPGAEVKIIDQVSGNLIRTLTTDDHGAFDATLLPVASYNIEVRASGFAIGKVTGIAVRVTETTQIRVTLQVGQLTQTVQVNSQVTAVESTTPATGETLESQTIGGLPLPTRNVQQLLTLSAGASSDLTSAGDLGRGDIRMNVDGQREGYNNVQIEGISVSDYNVSELTTTPLPNPDAIEEFKVQTSLYDATQGRNGGGNINAVLRGGSPKFHGALFEYFRNNVLNANDFFFNADGTPRPVVRQNIFGGSIGGPLAPHASLGFFFFNYQGTRQLSGIAPGTFINTVIPTIPVQRDPADLAMMLPPGFQNPSTLDPVAVNLLNFKSNQFGGGTGGWLIPSLPPINPSLPLYEQESQLTVSHPGTFDDDQFTANWDRNFSGGRDVLHERFFYSDFKSLLPYGAGNLGSQFGAAISEGDLDFPTFLPVHDRFVTISETHTFSAHFINDFRFGFVRIANDTDNGALVNLSDLGISRPNSNFDTNIYRFELASYQIGPTPAANVASGQDNFTFLDTVGYNLGAHALRFGGQVDRIYLDKNYPQLFNGMVDFVPSEPVSEGGNGFTDFQNLLIGAPAFSGAGSGVYNHEYRINNFALFLQDDYKVRKNLTLNLGLRWELDGAVSDATNQIGNLVTSLAQEGQDPWIFPKGVNSLNIPGLVGTGSPTLRNNGYASDWGPRIGFAYDVFGTGKTAIRGGCGIYYEREDNGTSDNLGFSSPFLAGGFGPAPPGTLANLPAFNGLPPAGVISPAFTPQWGVFQGFVNNITGAPTMDTTQTPVFSGNSEFLIALEAPLRFISPSAQQWNLTVEHEIAKGWVFDIGYVGTKGTHLREVSTPIQPYLVSTSNPVTLTAPNGTVYVVTQNTIANAPARARILGLSPSGMQCFCNDANSIYHSLQTSLTKRYRSLYFQAAYTYSKTIDDVSNDTTAFNTVLDDQTNLRDSRGDADFDRPHRFVASYSYQLPFFSKATGFKRAALNGWGVDGITIFQSGRPFTIIDSAGGSTYTPIGPDQSTASIVSGYDVASAYTKGSTVSRLGAYVNFAAFMPAPVVGPDGSTGYGDLGRNIFRGPFEQNWDFSVVKDFPFAETQNVEFRAEFFNLWNHPNFNNPFFVDVSGNPATFGEITSMAGTPRVIQFALRYGF